MTPRLEAALRAALAADAAGGLHYTVAGWIDPAAARTYHDGAGVTRLVFHYGYLDVIGPKSGPRQRRVITAEGRKYLQDKDAGHGPQR